MAGVKGPRPCLGLLGKGDWPLSTRAYPTQRHSPTHVHVLAHVQQAIRELGRELLSLSLRPPRSRRSPIPQNPALSPYELRVRVLVHSTYVYAPRIGFCFRLDFRVPWLPNSIFFLFFFLGDLLDHSGRYSIPEDELTSNSGRSRRRLFYSTDATVLVWLPFTSWIARSVQTSRFGRLWPGVLWCAASRATLPFSSCLDCVVVTLPDVRAFVTNLKKVVKDIQIHGNIVVQLKRINHKTNSTG